MSDDLPPGWALTDIGSLGRYINGRGFGKSEWKKSGMPIIRIQNLNDEAAPFNYSDRKHEEKYRVRDDDLLVAWAASLGVYVWKRGPAWLNQHIFRVEVEERAVTKPFLYYALKDALAGLYKKAHGSGMVHITKAKFDRHSVKLPPLNEQKRIVSKIDELFSRIDEGERALERVSKLVERYRQSVLKAVVTGELTREWREQRKADSKPIESGETLLNRILIARREAWEKAELMKMQAKDITPKNDSWKKKYVEPRQPDIENLPQLPNGWVWTSFEQLVCLSQNGLSKRSGETGRPVKVLRLADVTDGEIVGGDPRKIRLTDEEAQRYSLLRGDLICVRVNGSRSLTGRLISVTSMDEWAYCDHFIRFRPVPDLVSYQFLDLCFDIGVTRNAVESSMVTTAGQNTVSQGSLFQVPLPLPPLEEQQVLLSEFELRISQAFGQARDVLAARRTSVTLRQAVLKAAFAGRLAAQDAIDEPASALLDRITTEHTNTAAPKRGGKKKTA